MDPRTTGAIPRVVNDFFMLCRCHTVKSYAVLMEFYLWWKTVDRWQLKFRRVKLQIKEDSCHPVGGQLSKVVTSLHLCLVFLVLIRVQSCLAVCFWKIQLWCAAVSTSVCSCYAITYLVIFLNISIVWPRTAQKKPEHGKGSQTPAFLSLPGLTVIPNSVHGYQ